MRRQHGKGMVWYLYRSTALRSAGPSTVTINYPQVYLTYQFHTAASSIYKLVNQNKPRRARETSVDRHATEQEYYPSIITQENPNGRRGRTYD